MISTKIFFLFLTLLTLFLVSCYSPPEQETNNIESENQESPLIVKFYLPKPNSHFVTGQFCRAIHGPGYCIVNINSPELREFSENNKLISYSSPSLLKFDYFISHPKYGVITNERLEYEIIPNINITLTSSLDGSLDPDRGLTPIEIAMGDQSKGTHTLTYAVKIDDKVFTESTTITIE